MITEEKLWIAAAIVVAAGVVAVTLLWALLRSGHYPAPTMLVLSVSLLSITALIGGLVTRSDSALAIASAGLGALAGAVSSTFTIQPRVRRENEEQERDE